VILVQTCPKSPARYEETSILPVGSSLHTRTPSVWWIISVLFSNKCLQDESIFFAEHSICQAKVGRWSKSGFGYTTSSNATPRFEVSWFLVIVAGMIPLYLISSLHCLIFSCSPYLRCWKVISVITALGHESVNSSVQFHCSTFVGRRSLVGRKWQTKKAQLKTGKISKIQPMRRQHRYGGVVGVSVCERVRMIASLVDEGTHAMAITVMVGILEMKKLKIIKTWKSVENPSADWCSSAWLWSECPKYWESSSNRIWLYLPASEFDSFHPPARLGGSVLCIPSKLETKKHKILSPQHNLFCLLSACSCSCTRACVALINWRTPVFGFIGSQKRKIKTKTGKTNWKPLRIERSNVQCQVDCVSRWFKSKSGCFSWYSFFFLCFLVFLYVDVDNVCRRMIRHVPWLYRVVLRVGQDRTCVRYDWYWWTIGVGAPDVGCGGTWTWDLAGVIGGIKTSNDEKIRKPIWSGQKKREVSVLLFFSVCQNLEEWVGLSWVGWRSIVQHRGSVVRKAFWENN